MKHINCPLCSGTGKIIRHNKGPKAEPVEKRFWSKVQKGSEDECWAWKAFINSKSGYGQFSNYQSHKNVGAHRVAYELSTGEILTYSDMICHKCHNRKCCNPKHLYKGDALTNSQDMIKAGRSRIPVFKKGFSSPNSVVSPEQVLQIRSEWTGKNASGLARKYSLGRTTIGRIVHKQGMYADT